MLGKVQLNSLLMLFLYQAPCWPVNTTKIIFNTHQKQTAAQFKQRAKFTNLVCLWVLYQTAKVVRLFLVGLLRKGNSQVMYGWLLSLLRKQGKNQLLQNTTYRSIGMEHVHMQLIMNITKTTSKALKLNLCLSGNGKGTTKTTHC